MELLEIERLQAVKRYDVLDTPADGNFDRITKLAARVFNMPIVLITIVDKDRIWFKSRQGLDGIDEINRDPGLCASAILSNDVYLVENAKDDPRCLTNPLVCGEFGLRFYAAAPLQTQDGFNLGTLCLIDKKPRFLNSDQRRILQEMAGIVIDELELRLAARQAINKSNQRIAELEKKLRTR